MRRRELLKLLACASAAPAIFIPKRVRAATPAFGAAKHLLVLYAQGGFRSHPTFNAVGTHQHNPFGKQSVAPGTEWALGAACGAEPITSRFGVVDPLASWTNEVAVIASVDHTPRVVSA